MTICPTPPGYGACPGERTIDPRSSRRATGSSTQLADALETELIETAQADAARARDLADEAAATPAELRAALRFVAHSAEDAALVAVLRGERLGLDGPSLD
ncbi:hypothetical protein ACPCSK_06650 [Streptomyces griseoincarnatus]